MMQSPIKIAVTGAAGQIGYSLVFRIASGAMFGPNQPIAMSLIEIPSALGALEGVVMELHDCAFPLLKSLTPTADLDEGFRDMNWALLVGSVPRKAGMERKDLLGINGKIFIGQGQAIERNASADVRILVIGNPCNTNCLIAMNNAKGIPRDRWFAMTRLDENRAKAQLAHKAGVEVTAEQENTARKKSTLNAEPPHDDTVSRKRSSIILESAALNSVDTSAQRNRRSAGERRRHAREAYRSVPRRITIPTLK